MIVTFQEFSPTHDFFDYTTADMQAFDSGKSENGRLSLVKNGTNCGTCWNVGGRVR
jgi:hypothetical protein